MELDLKIKYENGETRHITSDLNEEQAKKLVEYLKSGNYGMKEAIIKVESKN